MKNVVLNLLLNYHGTISRKVYCAGIILLLIIVGISAGHKSYNISVDVFAARLDSGFLIRDFIILRQLVLAFTPVVIPTYFLIFYSTLVVTVKRSRSLGLSRPLTVSLVTVNVLFLNFMLRGVEIAGYIDSVMGSNHDANYFVSPNALLWFVVVCSVCFIVLNLYFMLNKRGEDDNTETVNALIKRDASNKSSYGQFDYVFFIGKLMLVNLAILVIVAFVFYFFQVLLFKSIVIAALYFGALLGFYFRATAKRLNDAGYKTFFLVLYLIFVIIIAVLLAYLISLDNQYSLLFIALSVPAFFMLTAFQIVPFLLKTRE